MSAFLFQVGDQSAHEILDDMEEGRFVEHFPFRSYRSSVQVGDEIILLLMGPGDYARAFASYIVISGEEHAHHPRSYRDRDLGRTSRPGFRAELNGMLQRDVTRTELRRHPAFEGFPFNRARLVNPFELNDAQVDAIYDLSEDLVSV